jgi:hypothetical protein
MPQNPHNVHARVGILPAQRLRWLLDFGKLDAAALNATQRGTAVREARAFMLIQKTEPAVRPILRVWPPPRDDSPNVMSEAEAWTAQRWLRRGLDRLQRGKIWSFPPRIKYELDSHKGRLWARFTASSPVEEFKAFVYEAMHDARFNVRLCPECQRQFVPVRRQAYCSAGCSQAVRTRKWRRAHPEKNRAIRRQQYQRSKTAELGLSKRAAINIAKPRQRSPK